MEFKYLTQEEIQQMTFDWRYRGFTTLKLLTEEECDEINDELANDEVIELNEAPQSDDPAEWEAFLAAEGLIDPELDDFSDMLNDDEF